MISAEERRQRAQLLGVPEGQVARDHLISHVLHVLSQREPRDFAFFGGTALCRTWCDDARLSEDVDLLVDDHRQAADSLLPWISRGIRRDHPEAVWVHLGGHHEVETRRLDGGGGVTVNVQLVRWRDDWRVLSMTEAPVKLRYSDLPSEALLVVPTPASFVAMKLAAWIDRRACRDLFDLRELARRGHVTSEVLELFRHINGFTPSRATVGRRVPRATADSWTAELGQQTRVLPTPAACLDTVLEALDRLHTPQE